MNPSDPMILLVQGMYNLKAPAIAGGAMRKVLDYWKW